MYRLIAAIGIVAAVALLALGCGSASDGGETVEALTKAQFIKQADEACAEVAKKREAAARSWRKEHPGSLATEELNEAFKEVIAPSVKEQVEALQALAAPEADSAEVARMVDNLLKVSRDLEEEGVEGMGQPEVSQYEDEARTYGLKVCPRLA